MIYNDTPLAIQNKFLLEVVRHIHWIWEICALKGGLYNSGQIKLSEQLFLFFGGENTHTQAEV